MDHSAQLPISTIDFPSPKALRKAAERVQDVMIQRLLEGGSPEVRALKKFEIVQRRLVPTKKEIAAGLLAGHYAEYL